MAKVLVENDCIAIRASLLERMMLSEKSRKLPLSRVRSVDPHPPLLDMMVHWADQSSVWLGGVSTYEGHMIPATRNPRSTLAIEVEDEDEPRVYVEVDDEPPEEVAARISRAIGSEPPPAFRSNPPPSLAPEVAGALTTNRLALELARAQRVDAEDDRDEREDDEGESDDNRRDPIMPQATPPDRGQVGEIRLDDDHDLARVGGWMLALGSLGLLAGLIMLIAGGLPGLLVMLAGVLCAAFGGVALALVAHHQG